MEVNGQLHALATLSLEKEPCVSIEYEAGQVPVLVVTFWKREKKNLLSLLGIEPLFFSLPAHNPFTILTVQSWLTFIWNV